MLNDQELNRKNFSLATPATDSKKKRSYVIRQAVQNNSKLHPNLRQAPYIGFFMFSKMSCGQEFFDGILNGDITMGISDHEATYQVKSEAFLLSLASLTCRLKCSLVKNSRYQFRGRQSTF